MLFRKKSRVTIVRTPVGAPRFGAPAPTPIPTPTAIPIAIPTPTAIPIAIPTPTAIPIATPTPTTLIPATPIPTSVPEPEVTVPTVVTENAIGSGEFVVCAGEVMLVGDEDMVRLHLQAPTAGAIEQTRITNAGKGIITIRSHRRIVTLMPTGAVNCSASASSHWTMQPLHATPASIRTD